MGRSILDPKKPKTTRLFRFYVINLVIRAVLLVLAVVALFLFPVQISMSEGFGFAHGLTLIDIIFIAVLADSLTKLFPNASIAIGSLKQYDQYHLPTFNLFRAGSEEQRHAWLDALSEQRQEIISKIKELPQQALSMLVETRDSVVDTLKVLLSNVSFLKILPIPKELLRANDPIRAQIKADRWKEIIPVIIFWLLFNTAIGIVLRLLGLLTEQIVVIWMLFYFLFDMICVVLWCPLQLLFMKNRCCTTCQIFNWDAAMTVTPLLFVAWQLSTSWFSWPLIILALIVLIRWEVAFARHPERFDERTNASLACANCTDKLCYIRKPLKTRFASTDFEALLALLPDGDESLETASRSNEEKHRIEEKHEKTHKGKCKLDRLS